MTQFANLLTELDSDGILTLTVHRPQALNALNKITLEELAAAIQYADSTPEVKAVLVTGAGPKSFVAGADIGEFSLLTNETSRQFAERGQYVFRRFEECRKPVLAAVNGFALGGGCELAMACHLRVASENARFGQPEVNLGIIPGYGGTQRLTHLIGKGRAMELMLTADMVNAADAHRIGLVNHVVPADELIPFSKNLLRKILTKGPVAVSYVIEAVNAACERPHEGYDVEASGFAACCATEDFHEGPKAFLEKRAPNFQGR